MTRPALRPPATSWCSAWLSLLLELGIMYWVLNGEITRPLLTFTEAADQVAAGDFHVAAGHAARG